MCRPHWTHGEPGTCAQPPQAGVCRPARARTQPTLAPTPGCSLRFLEFQTSLGPGLASRREEGPQAPGLHRTPWSPRKPEPQKGSALNAPQRPEAGTPATRPVRKAAVRHAGTADTCTSSAQGAATPPSPVHSALLGAAPAWGRGKRLIPLRVTRVLTTLPPAGIS